MSSLSPKLERYAGFGRFEAHIASGALTHVLVDYPPPQAGIYLVRPPGEFAPRKVRALIDILIEHFGDGSI